MTLVILVAGPGQDDKSETQILRLIKGRFGTPEFGNRKWNGELQWYTSWSGGGHSLSLFEISRNSRRLKVFDQKSSELAAKRCHSLFNHLYERGVRVEPSFGKVQPENPQ